MLVSMKEMLREADQKGYAVGGFNCATMESARAALAAAEELGLPFILQHAEVHEEYIPLELAASVMLTLAKTARVPVCVHLDHGGSIENVSRALRLGFTSVMIDASAKGLEANTEETRMVVRMAHAVGATVEAELGNMPNNLNDNLGEYRPEDFYTVPEDASAFVKATGVDALAISFGTVHGVYKDTPKLDFDIVRRVREATDGLPLVMHGGSGLTPDDYHQAIQNGIRKINYYTYEALAGGRGTYDIVQRIPQKLRFHDVAMAATEWMKRDVMQAMRLFAGEDA